MPGPPKNVPWNDHALAAFTITSDPVTKRVKFISKVPGPRGKWHWGIIDPTGNWKAGAANTFGQAQAELTAAGG